MMISGSSDATTETQRLSTSKLTKVLTSPGLSHVEDLTAQLQTMKESLRQVQRTSPRYRITDWADKVEIMDPIDEVITTISPQDQYNLDFIEESDCGDDGKWVKHISKTNKKQTSAVIISDPVSPPSPVTRQVLREYQEIIMLSKVNEYLYALESSSDSDEYDSDLEDDDDDGIIHCSIDGVQQPQEPRYLNFAIILQISILTFLPAIAVSPKAKWAPPAMPHPKTMYSRKNAIC